MSADPRVIADQLLADFDTIRATVEYTVIVELRQRVEDHKFHDPTRALEIAEIATVAASLLGEPKAEALAAWAKATALLFNGQSAEAIPLYRRAEALYGELTHPVEQVSVQAPLVYALNAVGEPEAALALATQVQTHCETLGAPARQALAHLEMNIGTIRKQQGAFAASLAACDRAKALFAALHDAEGVARAEMNRANVLQEMDRFADAATAYAAARPPLLISQRNRQQVALIDFNLGLLAERRGRLLEALRYLEAARDGFKPIVHQAAADLNRAMIYNQLNLPVEAQQLAQSAEAIFVANAMEMEAGHALLIIGIAERQLGHYLQSQRALQAANARFDQHQADFWSATAQLALVTTTLQAASQANREQAEQTQSYQTQSYQTQSYQMAQTVYKMAERATWPTVMVEAQLLMARARLASQPVVNDPPLAPELIHQLQASIDLASHYHLTFQLLESYTLLGEYYRRQTLLGKAWHAYTQAILLLEDVRATLQIDELQLGYLADKATIYARAIALAYSTERTEQNLALLLYLFNLLAIAPLPTHASNNANPTDPQTQALIEELQTLREAWQWQQHKLTDPTNSIDATRMALGQLEGQIADCQRRIRVRQQSDASLTIAPRFGADLPVEQAALAFYRGLQTKLAPHEAMLVYAKIDETLVALVLRHTAGMVIPLGEFPAVEKLLATWRFHVNDHALIQQNPSLAQPMAKRILAAFHRALLAPLTAQLTDCAHLFVTLPPSLHDLPIAAFWNDGYLIEEYQLTYLSAPAALLKQQPALIPTDQQHAVIIGHSHAGTLPHAVAEAKAVAAAVASYEHCDLFCDEEAHADAILAASIEATLLHIAAHAHFATTGPLFSAIHLADRELTLLELYHGAQFHRHPLVVLSTCVSGQGTTRGGGLLGLARAFFAAGAGQLVVTLWRVDDESTATLMATMYRTLIASQPEVQPGTALRQAQLAAAQTLHPLHWAGFCFIQG